MKLVAMSGNQLGCVTQTCTLLYNCHEPLATVQCCHFDGEWAVALGGSIWNGLGLFLFGLSTSWLGLAACLLLWLMGIPEASHFMSILWNKNSVPGVNENFLTQLTTTNSSLSLIQLDFWISLLSSLSDDMAVTRAWRGDHGHSAEEASSSDLIRGDTPGLTLDSGQIMNHSASMSPFVQTSQSVFHCIQ